MGISDVSSDVGSSDLGLLAPDPQLLAGGVGEDVGRRELRAGAGGGRHADRRDAARRQRVSRQGVVQGGRLGRCDGGDRKRGVKGKSVSGRVDLGGGRIIKKKYTR